MSDTVIETDNVVEDDTPDAPQAEPQADLGDAGKKALDAERAAKRAAEKRAREAEARVKELEDKDKTEAEKAAARAEAAEKALAEVTAKALRLEVATEFKLDPDLHEFLTGTDEDSLRQQAQKLAERFAATAGPRQPKPDPTQGAKPGGSGPRMLTSDEVSEMYRQGRTAEIDAARREGRIAL